MKKAAATTSTSTSTSENAEKQNLEWELGSGERGSLRAPPKLACHWSRTKSRKGGVVQLVFLFFGRPFSCKTILQFFNILLKLFFRHHFEHTLHMFVFTFYNFFCFPYISNIIWFVCFSQLVLICKNSHLGLFKCRKLSLENFYLIGFNFGALLWWPIWWDNAFRWGTAHTLHVIRLI